MYVSIAVLEDRHCCSSRRRCIWRHRQAFCCCQL